MKAKAGNGGAALSVLPFGNGLWHTPSLTAHGHRPIQGWLGAKADPGTLTARQRGQAGASTPLHAFI